MPQLSWSRKVKGQPQRATLSVGGRDWTFRVELTDGGRWLAQGWKSGQRILYATYHNDRQARDACQLEATKAAYDAAQVRRAKTHESLAAHWNRKDSSE